MADASAYEQTTPPLQWDLGGPWVRVERTGRWMHYITAGPNTLTTYNELGWFVLGAKRAGKKARRILDREKRKAQRETQRYELT